SEYLRAAGITDVNIDNLNKSILTTKVESTNKELMLDGKPKDAINYPNEKEIEFNRARWDAMTSKSRAILVLHEYLGILRIPDIGYSVSLSALKNYKSPVDSNDFERGALSVVKVIPTIRDPYTKGGVGFIS